MLQNLNVKKFPLTKYNGRAIHIQLANPRTAFSCCYDVVTNKQAISIVVRFS